MGQEMEQDKDIKTMINVFSKVELNETEQETEQDEDAFRNMPLEIMTLIFSKVGADDIARCKVVCKFWKGLVDTPEFLPYHTPVPGLAVYQWKSTSDLKSGLKPYKVYGFANKSDPEYSTRHCYKAFNFGFIDQKPIHSSANGLLFLCDNHKELFICNPVTRDYIELPSLEGVDRYYPHPNTFGFGFSRMTGQYKLVWICRVPQTQNETRCDVYTLGTGSWRSIGSAGRIGFGHNIKGVCLNGNLHWLYGSGKLSIRCFDLETEVFSKLSPPSLRSSDLDNMSLSALGDCLCLCDNTFKSEINIWLMSTCGDWTMSTCGDWTKQFSITKTRPPCYLCGPLFPIKVFEDGDILIASEGWSRLLRYYKETGVLEDTKEFDLQFRGSDYRTSAVIYTPTFYPLTTFTMEKVLSF